MLIPPDNHLTREWLQRLDIAAKHLPAAEREKLLQEIRQHLESLAAEKMAQGQSFEAAWEAALKQFGDPTQIGRKVYGEWRLGRTGFQADMTAILFGLGLQVARNFVIRLFYALWFDRLYSSSDRLYTHGHGIVGFAFVVFLVITWGGTVLIGATLGRKYPLQAIKGTFYAYGINWCWTLTFIAFTVHSHPNPHLAPETWIAVLAPLPWLPCVIAAYLASVTRRGWYRPTLADFKLTVPRRRPQLTR